VVVVVVVVKRRVACGHQRRTISLSRGSQRRLLRFRQVSENKQTNKQTRKSKEKQRSDLFCPPASEVHACEMGSQAVHHHPDATRHIGAHNSRTRAMLAANPEQHNTTPQGVWIDNDFQFDSNMLPQ
jgi:hypothetical protein